MANAGMIHQSAESRVQ